MPARILLIDCDSTLSAIEGVDELGRLRGPDIFRAVEDMTNAAMNGGTPLQEVFAKRLDMIRPTRAMVSQVASQYIRRQAPGLASALAAVRKAGWTPVIVSGGFRQAILPLARHLAIGRVEAVDLVFSKNGNYAGFDKEAPTARAGGKPEVVRMLRRENPGAAVVMLGDGASDLECRGVADLFVGFGGFVEREKVKAAAEAYIHGFDELPELLAARFDAPGASSLRA